MSKLNAFTEVLFRGMLASYLLFFAFQMHKNPDKYSLLISENVARYAQSLSINGNYQLASIRTFLQYYSQILVVISLATMCGFKTGKMLSWIFVLLNLALTWNQIEIMFLGIHMLIISLIK